MKNRLILKALHVGLSALCLLVGSVFAAPNGTLDTSVTPNTYTITVGEGVDVTLNSDDVTALGTNVKLIKEGGGRLIITNNMSTWEGDFDIDEGYVRLSESYADGKQDTGTLTLTPGATIELGGDGVSANRALLRRKYIYIGGYGMNNAGAVYAIGNSQNQIFRGGANVGASVTYLTADTYFKCSPTIGPRAGTFRLQGYKLIADGGTFNTCGEVMHGPGELIMTNSCCLYFENGAQAMLYAGSSGVGPITDNVIRLYQGCSIKQGGNGVGFWYPARVPFKVIAEGDATLTTGWNSNAGPQYAGYDGGLEVKEDFTVTISGGLVSGTPYLHKFSGVISGNGDIGKTGTHECVISNANNTFAGKFTITAGTADIFGFGSIPPALNGGIIGAAGTINLDLSQDTLDDNKLSGIYRGFMTNSVLPSSIAVVGGGIADANLFHAKVDLGQAYTFSEALADPALITHAGEETLTLTSSTLARSCLMNYGGSIKFAGTHPQEVGWIEVRGGDVTVESGTVVNVNSNAFLGAEYPEVARLKLKGKYLSDVRGVGIEGGRTFVQCKDTMRGVTEIFEGALVTNAFTAAVNNAGWATHCFYQSSQVRAMTSFYMHGGEFQANASVHFIGNYRNFFCSMESGLAQFCDSSEVRAARWCANTYSAVHQTGGVWKLGSGSDYTFGNCGGVAYHYVTNGTTCVNGSGASMGLGRMDWENGGTGAGSIGTLTADGPNALIDLPITGGYSSWRASVQFTKQNNGVSIINLNNGGSLAVNRLDRPVSVTVGEKLVTFTNSHAYVGFDGGQLKLAYDFLSGSTPVPEIFVNWRDTDDHIWVFGGGAVIDVAADKNRTLGAALETPDGNGIASIDLPDEVANLAAWDYTGAPLVTIADSTGVGASAVALFDTATGKVTGIRVVNRGVGYTAPTVKLVKGGYTNDLVATAHLSANASGGFTKQGAGTLALDKACSYTGMTTVAAGTLKLGVGNAINSSATVKVSAGATYDQNGYASSVPVFGSGAVKGDATAALDWTVDASDIAAGSCLAVDGKLTVPAGCVVTVERPELLDRSSYKLATATTLAGAAPSVSGLPTTWKVVCSQSDNTLLLKNLVGTILLFR